MFRRKNRVASQRDKSILKNLTPNVEKVTKAIVAMKPLKTELTQIQMSIQMSPETQILAKEILKFQTVLSSSFSKLDNDEELYEKSMLQGFASEIEDLKSQLNNLFVIMQDLEQWNKRFAYTYDSIRINAMDTLMVLTEED